MTPTEAGRAAADRLFEELSPEELPEAFRQFKMRLLANVAMLDEGKDPALDHIVSSIHKQ